MVQGPQLGAGALWDNIVVEIGSVAQVLRPHDLRETKALGWNSRALAVLGPLVEAYGDRTMKELYRALVVNAREMERANAIENRDHASLFTVAEAVA